MVDTVNVCKGVVKVVRETTKVKTGTGTVSGVTITDVDVLLGTVVMPCETNVIVKLFKVDCEIPTGKERGTLQINGRSVATKVANVLPSCLIASVSPILK